MYHLKILILCLVYAAGIQAQSSTTDSVRPGLETIYRVVGIFHYSKGIVALPSRASSYEPTARRKTHSGLEARATRAYRSAALQGGVLRADGSQANPLRPGGRSYNPRIRSAVVIYHLKKRKQQLYWVGDLLDGGLARLTRVEADGAYIYYYGDYYFMPVMRYSDPAATSIVRKSSKSRSVAAITQNQNTDRSDGNRLQSAIRRLKGLAGLHGNAIKKEAEGLRVSELKPDSMLYRAGLRNGDLIQTFNSKKIREDLKVTTLMRAMRLKGQGIKLGIIRDGRPIELEVKKVSLPKLD